MSILKWVSLSFSCWINSNLVKCIFIELFFILITPGLYLLSFSALVAAFYKSFNMSHCDRVWLNLTWECHLLGISFLPWNTNSTLTLSNYLLKTDTKMHFNLGFRKGSRMISLSCILPSSSAWPPVFLQCVQAKQFCEPGKAYRSSLEQKGRNTCSLGALACGNKLSILFSFSFQLCTCLSFCLYTAICCYCSGASFMYRLIIIASSQIEHSWVLDVSCFHRDSRVFQVEVV